MEHQVSISASSEWSCIEYRVCIFMY